MSTHCNCATQFDARSGRQERWRVFVTSSAESEAAADFPTALQPGASHYIAPNCEDSPEIDANAASLVLHIGDLLVCADAVICELLIDMKSSVSTLLVTATGLNEWKVFTRLLQVFAIDGLLTDEQCGSGTLHALARSRPPPGLLSDVLPYFPLSAHLHKSSDGELPIQHTFRNGVVRGRVTPADVEVWMRFTPDQAIREKNAEGENALHLLARGKLPDLINPVVNLLGRTALLEQDDQGFTPLHRAVHCRHADCILVLLSIASGEEFAITNNEGLLPVESGLLGDPGMKRQHEERNMWILRLVERCKEEGIMERTSWALLSPLHIAAARCAPAVVEAVAKCPHARKWALTPDCNSGTLLIHHTLVQARQASTNWQYILPLMMPEELEESVPATGETPLHLAIRAGSYHAVESLVIQLDKAAIDIKDHSGKRPIVTLLCCMNLCDRISTCDLRILGLLLRKSDAICPLEVEEWCQIDGTPPIEAIVELVRRYPAEYLSSTTARDWECGNPLHFVCSCERDLSTVVDMESKRILVEELLTLLPQDFTTMPCGQCRMTPVQLAAQTGSTIVLAAMLQLEIPCITANLDFPEEPSALEYAIRCGDERAVRLLVDRMSPDDCRQPASDGQSFLSLLCSVAEQRGNEFAGTAEAIRRILHPMPKSAAS